MHLIVLGVATTLAALAGFLLSGWNPGWGVAVVAPLHVMLMIGLCHRAPSWICPTITRAPDRRRKRVAITFDDGPHPDVTPRVLGVLAEKTVRATFFCIGRHARRHPDVVRAIAAAGHELGNHSYSHPRHLYAWSASALFRDTRLSQRAIRRAAGVQPVWYRPPIGFRNLFMRRMLRLLNLRLANFTFRSYDTVARTPDAIVDRVLRHVSPGAIILLHDGADRHPDADRTPLLAALPILIDQLREKGYELLTLGDLLQSKQADDAGDLHLEPASSHVLTRRSRGQA